MPSITRLSGRRGARQLLYLPWRVSRRSITFHAPSTETLRVTRVITSASKCPVITISICRRRLFQKTKAESKEEKRKMSLPSTSSMITTTSIIVGGAIFYILYQNNYVQPLPATETRSHIAARRQKQQALEIEQKENADELSELPFQNTTSAGTLDGSAWESFASKFASLALVTNVSWVSISDSITDYILPEWAKMVPGYIQKLQRELSMAPGSLAAEIWEEAHDPDINPEITAAARVRVSTELCDQEKEFLSQRNRFTRVALAKYLGIPEEEVHPDDVPRIAMVGSGGGLRAMVAGAGSMLAASEDGLFDCVTYTAGVSGSCWLQALYHSSLGRRRFDNIVNHLKHRIGVHFAYPPVALSALNTAPTNKFLLSGFVEKLKGDPKADFGLVDIYGLLLAARLLVPKGELGVNHRDLKISNQRDGIKNGEHPMPIYTAVRHEIPIDEEASTGEKITGEPSEATKARAKREAYYQWFEISPYEMFCEEFTAGIPTWALGRQFKQGRDVDVDGFRPPELRLSLLLGVFSSAFCATLSHYYKELRPIVKGLVGFASIDELISGRNEDLSKVHPIEPASMPNFTYDMKDQLPESTPESVYTNDHIQLMDAGMSNNLPIYPLLRPGRDIDILIAFDASADIRTENWLSVADGYALQRGIKGWPLGLGWPKASDLPEKTGEQLDEGQASSAAEAETKVAEAKVDDISEGAVDAKNDLNRNSKTGDLGYCTVWVGSRTERDAVDTPSSQPPPSKQQAEDWQLTEPDAGIAVVYFPFLANPEVKDVDPETSDYLSTWNSVYTAEEIDRTVALSKANFEEGKERTRRVVRAVYERRKRLREEREERVRYETWRRKVRLGVVGKKGEGDHFS